VLLASCKTACATSTSLALSGHRMNFQDAADYSEASYEPDLARQIDQLDDHVAEIVSEEWQGHPSAAVSMTCRVVRRLLDEHRLNESVDVASMSGRDILAQVVAMVVGADNPKLVARAVDLVFQLGAFGGMSETAMARAEGCTRANACHYVMQVKDRFFKGKDIPWLRSEQARKTYAKRQIGRANQSQPWEFADHLKP